MTITKNKIKIHFDKASNTYEKVANVQRQCAKFLISELRKFDHSFYPKTILDLGTGTGYVPEILIKYYPKSLYTLNDIAPKMVATTRLKFSNYNNFRFSIGDLETINFEHYHLILSNLALQWANDLWGTLQKFYQQSSVFAFSCLLDGTFSEWQKILNSYGILSVIKKQPTEQELIRFCNHLDSDKFCFWVKDFQLKFSNTLLFMKYLKNLGAGMSGNSLPISVLKTLMFNHNEPLTITYKIFFAILKR